MNDAKLEKVVVMHIYYMVNDQVEREYEQRTSVADALFSATYELSNDEDEPADVMEWWTVSIDFAYHAKKNDEIIVETPFGIVWGRQVTGQALLVDHIVREILNTIV